MFKSLLISKMYGRHSAQIAEIAESELPQGDVEVNVDCSSINYKDALAITASAYRPALSNGARH